MQIKISEIKINPGRRDTQQRNVEELARSIAAVGLMNPITLDQNNTLIAGLHRLEAAKLMGWTEIECNIIGMSGLQAELAEIDENIVRTKLTKQELPDLWQQYVEKLSEYMASTGKTYQNHAATIRRWAAEDRRKGKSMHDWTFANDNGKCPQMKHAHFYVEHWDTMLAENIGYLLWGGVGTGKSYFAGCIANALMEREITVRMTNFALILNDLTASFEGRNEYISQLCRALLLIIDDFGMERGTEYGLEQVYNVIDSRYRSRRPLIVTTNIPLQDLQHPQDTAHARIYDRLLEMCAPIRFSGENFRKVTAQDKLARLKNLMD